MFDIASCTRDYVLIDCGPIDLALALLGWAVVLTLFVLHVAPLFFDD